MNSRESKYWSGWLFFLPLLILPSYLLLAGGLKYLAISPVFISVLVTLKSLAALGILFSLPGIYLPFFLLRSPRLSFFNYLSWSVGLNWLFLLIATTLIKGCGYPVQTSNLLGIIIPVALVSAALASRRRREVAISVENKKMYLVGAILLVGLLCLAYLSFHPFLISENRIWPNEYHRLFRQLKFTTPEIHQTQTDNPEGKVSWEWDQNWCRPELHQLRPQSGRAYCRLFNPSPTHTSLPLIFLFDGREEMALDLSFNGHLIFSDYLPPPYQIRNCPRNFPPAQELFSGKVELLPGENLLEFNFTSPSGKTFRERPDVLIWNFSHSSRREFSRIFQSYYLIGDTGDIREQLNLARNLKEKVSPFTYSYDGTIFDGGGYTIEHPLFPFLLKMVMLTLGEDSLKSFQLLFWGLLGALLFTMLRCTAEAEAKRIFPWFLLGGGIALSLFLIRYRLDTPYLTTTLSLTTLLALSHLQRRETGLFLLWSSFTILSKGGVIFIFLGLLCFLILERNFRYFFRSLLIVIFLTILLLAPMFILTSRDTGSLQWKILFSGNYQGRFPAWAALFQGRGGLLRQQLATAARYLWMVSIGSGFLVLGWVLPKSRRAKFFLLLSVFSSLVVAFSRPSIIGAHYYGHRLSYLAPLIFFVPLPTISALLSYSGRKAKWWFIFFGLLLLLSATQIKPILRSYREVMAHPYLKVSHRVSLLDFLLRRFSRDKDGYDRVLISRLLSRFPDLPAAGERTYAVVAGMLEEAGLNEEATSWRQNYVRQENKSP